MLISNFMKPRFVGKSYEELSCFPTCGQAVWELQPEPPAWAMEVHWEQFRADWTITLSLSSFSPASIQTTGHLNSRSCPENGAGNDASGTVLSESPQQLCDSRELRSPQRKGKHGCGYLALTLSSTSGCIWKSFHSWVSQFLPISGNSTYFVWLLRKNVVHIKRPHSAVLIKVLAKSHPFLGDR